MKNTSILKRRRALRLRRTALAPPFLGVPSIVPGGRAARSIAMTFAVGLPLVGVVATGATPVVAAHAAVHADTCIDVPVATFGVSGGCGEPSPRVEVRIPGCADGEAPRYRIRGRSYDASGLARELRDAADEEREREGSEAPSAVWVDIRADRETPWRVIQRIFDACSRRDTLIYKVRFLVRADNDLPCSFAPVPARSAR